MARRKVYHTVYRVWWAGGGHRHFDEIPSDPNTLKHPDPKRFLDLPARIDKIQVIWVNEANERAYEEARHKYLMKEAAEKKAAAATKRAEARYNRKLFK